MNVVLSEQPIFPRHPFYANNRLAVAIALCHLLLSAIHHPTNLDRLPLRNDSGVMLTYRKLVKYGHNRLRAPRVGSQAFLTDLKSCSHYAFPYRHEWS